ncbi:preprotein translocase subunit SecE [Candidatus Peregrinibacteria bacterium]|mgnify:CR=1 FL=1|jgi:preprotein translocase SecE subunit|nr:preprotein translocase subunit SecE [Candidatus Peregrinibacteria bacterium]MBT4632006.1 preprotein translocase subunit SecE [Candidatus Peregrinibacteria bacterium]MBT5516713.1 preprotein translocase subunit SecE [Candidatus Peregrinibacteria bacterium]MBT5823791.1 preprotein translocase subunit SecE [Candidatus Peregrinibacteria bacterium]
MKKATNSVSTYLSDAFEEYRKITWPTKEQAALLTAIVVVVSILAITFIGLSDFGLTELYQLLSDLING